MVKKENSVRSVIIKAANELFYHNGYDETSFTQIAEKADISRGNFYHHFKTKEDILFAIVDYRVDDVTKTLKAWSDKYKTPIERIKRFIQILREEGGDAILYGCPMGTLNTQLGKSHKDLQPYARKIFDLFKVYLTEQFIQLGFTKSNAEQYALHLISRNQGISVVAHTYHDIKFLKREADILDEWVDQVTISGVSMKHTDI